MRVRIFPLQIIMGLLLIFGCTEDPDLLYSRAETEAELGSRQRALDHLIQIQRSTPTYTDAYLFAARLFFEDDNFIEAINQLKRGLDAGADSALITRYIGEIHHLKGSDEEAYRYYLQALRYNPDYEEVQISMGIILREKELRDRALNHFEQAMQINPVSYLAMVNRGITLGEMERTGEAIEILEQAIEDFPMDGPAYGALAYVQQKTGTVREAILDNYALAIRLSSKDRMLWDHYLDFMAADSNYQTVIKAYQRYTKEFPNDLVGQHRLQDIYLELATMESISWLDAARQACDRALLLDKDDHVSHANMARIYLLQEKPRLAILEAQLAFEIQPTSEYRELIDQARFLID